MHTLYLQRGDVEHGRGEEMGGATRREYLRSPVELCSPQGSLGNAAFLRHALSHCNTKPATVYLRVCGRQ